MHTQVSAVVEEEHKVKIKLSIPVHKKMKLEPI